MNLLGQTHLSYSVVIASLGLSCAAYAETPPGPASDGYEWRTTDKDGDSAPIKVDINSPDDSEKTGEPEAHYLPINHSEDISASASDTDSYCLPPSKGGDGIFYNYRDDVTSGMAADDHHMIWTIVGGDGEFIDSNRYGTSVVYKAPGYAAGSDLRTVSLKVEADDFQRGDDELGDSGDSKESDTIELKIWQITVTARQSGTKSEENDAWASPDAFGGENLGWVIPNSPAGATGYHGNTEVKGTIPEGPGVTRGYRWVSQKSGFVRERPAAGGPWRDVVNYGEAWFDDSPRGIYQDVNSKHDGEDVRKLFMMDAPGQTVGATNDLNIEAGAGDYDFQLKFRSFVQLGLIEISNREEWDVTFKLDVVDGKWHVISHDP